MPVGAARPAAARAARSHVGTEGPEPEGPEPGTKGPEPGADSVCGAERGPGDGSHADAAACAAASHVGADMRPGALNKSDLSAACRARPMPVIGSLRFAR